jgi:transcriptional regulator with XRE-family HTH domain
MGSTVADSFGATLRRRRVAAGLSQEELAERAGLSVRGVGNLEQGRRHAPRLATVRLLERVAHWLSALRCSGDECVPRRTSDPYRRRR